MTQIAYLTINTTGRSTNLGKANHSFVPRSRGFLLAHGNSYVQTTPPPPSAIKLCLTTTNSYTGENGPLVHVFVCWSFANRNCDASL